MSELLLNLLGSVAQFERSLIRERQREGVEAAKKRGVFTLVGKRLFVLLPMLT